jgi:predicted porin
MNRKILAAAVAGAITPMAAQALDVSVSGQVNRAIRFADNGVNSDVQNIDGSASKSRFRFTAEGELMPGITAGAHIEYGSSNNAGGALDIESEDKPAGFDPRHSLLYFSGDFGKVTLGNAPAAGNGVMWTSHNGAWMGTEYSPDTNSGLGVMNTDSTSTGYSVFSFFPSVNIGRKNTLRYDTPSIGPISVSASVQKDSATGHSWSFGASLGHDVGAANVIAGLIYMEDVLGIAGGLAFANGTSVNAAWGSDDDSGEDYEDMYINVAHSWGSMSVAVDYRSTENGADMEGRAIGLGAQYSLGGGVDVYAGFNSYSFDAPGADLEDINAFHIGSRVRFN